MVLNETNKDENITIFQSLKKKRNTGPFGLSKENPKLCSPNIQSFFCKIVNKCKKEQTSPDCLKIAKFIPLYKNGDKMNPEIYRLFSLLSPKGKINEKILFKHLIIFLANAS